MAMSKPMQFDILDEKKRMISGWASVEIVDKQNDIVLVSEMKKAMLTLMDRGGSIIFKHGNKPVGKVLQWDIKKHPDTNVLGVHFIAKIFDDYDIDDIVWEMIKKGEITGFSIGATAKEEKRLIKDDKSGMPKEVGILHDLSLLEISLVDKPANPLALIDQVNYIAKGDVEKIVDPKKEDDAKLKKRIESMEAMTKLKQLGEDLKKTIVDLKKSICKAKYGELIKASDEMLDAMVEVMKPFGKWESFADCVADMKSKGYSEESAKKICGKLQAEHEKQFDIEISDEKWARIDQWVAENAHKFRDKEHAIDVVMSKFNVSRRIAEDIVGDYVIGKEVKSLSDEKTRKLELIREMLNRGEISSQEAERLTRQAMLEEEKSLDEEVSEFLKERDRPPKEWWDKCVARIREGNKDYTDEQVNAVCGSMWYHQWGLGKSLDQEIIKAEYCPICGKVTEHKRARIGIRCVRCGHVKF